MAKKIPGSREEDSWFSEEQLDGLARADEADDLRSPIPTQMVSNGEYLPNPQTEAQKRVEAHIKELASSVSRHLGIGRRQFLAGSGGMAAAFLAMNKAFGAEYFRVDREEMYEPEAFARNGAPPNLFVLDDQLHTIRSSRTGPGNALRDIAQGNHSGLNPLDLPDELGGVNTPWNPALVGKPNLNSNFHLVQFVKDVYLDSQVTVGILSNNTSAAVPGQTPRPPKNITESEAGEFLSAPQTIAVRNWINEIAGSTRMLAHGQLFPGVGNQHDPVYGDYHRWQIENLKPDSWKGYTSANSAKLDPGNPDELFRRWRLDDEVVAYPMYQVITAPEYRHQLKKHPGFYNICIHKGLSTNAAEDPALGYPTDIPKAARDWPMLNFVIYHSCIRPGFWVLNALNDIRSGRTLSGVPEILWCTKFFVDCAPYRNVYAEIGTTFASSVITFPSVCAHILGQGMRFFGEDRIVFGSDAVWYGSPQWQIEALWRFEIPRAMRREFGYPKLTEGAKRKILGLNSGRMYKLAPGHLQDDHDLGHGDREEKGRRGHYHPVPVNYEALIPESLKAIMEFPGYAGTDNLSRLRQSYMAQGAQPSNTRYGWVRAGG